MRHVGGHEWMSTRQGRYMRHSRQSLVKIYAKAYFLQQKIMRWDRAISWPPTVNDKLTVLQQC